MEDTLIEEIRAAIRGRGVPDHGSVITTDSHLGRLCAIGGSDSLAVRTGKLMIRLRALAEGLPDDLRLAFLVAAGLHEEATHRYLKGRTRWLAERIDRTFRTAQRTIVDSVERIAALAEAEDESPYAPAGWSMHSMRAHICLRGSAPQITEEREIISVADGLREIVVSTAVPRHPAEERVPDLDFELLHGGSLISVERPGAAYFRYRIALSTPLRQGERHRLRVRHRFPADAQMIPRYTYRPVRPCESFTMTVDFHPERLPAAIWGIRGLPHSMVDDSRDERDLLEMDEMKEVRVDFSRLRPGLVYGARWSEGPMQRPSVIVGDSF